MEVGEEDEAGDSLLSEFDREVWSRAPHLEEGVGGSRVVNATPLIDITEALKACAKKVYGLDLDGKELKVLGKLESRVPGGSIKARPAVEIIRDAIATGKLRSGQTIFEATSGNFGIALGQFAKLGLDVVTLVSRRLQEGVFEGLGSVGIKTIDLDMDICPAPGLQIDSNTLAARAIALNMRSDLSELGFDPATFDASRGEVEGLLARQDAINLAKLLARIYGGFCPEQYDNELNALAHERVTAPEIEQQLAELGGSLADLNVVCTFGTGGTSAGLSRYVLDRYGKKAVRLVFPLAGQDVAGIRTKAKAAGLRFYQPERYAGEHEVDFSHAKRLLRFFAEMGYDIGESSALALYAVVQMANFGEGGRYLVILADGVEKYRRALEALTEVREEVTLQEAVSNIGRYGTVLWTHTMFVPSGEGVRLLAGSLGCEEAKVRIASAGDVERLVNNQEVTDGLKELLRDGEGKLLLVCMAGGTSLRATKVLSQNGIEAQSLSGGISALSQARGEQISRLVQAVAHH